MGKLVTLKTFSTDELLLSDAETKRVLIFFFDTQENTIENLKITDRMRGFAQGLLVEAIDASYAMGFVAAIFRATVDPTKGVSSILKAFGKAAFKHWFLHASANDLLSVKIYETVRLQLSLNFGRHFMAMRSGLVQNGNFSAFIAYESNSLMPSEIWS